MAMPHFRFMDRETEEYELFDAKVEFVGTDRVPPDWLPEEWDEYVDFLKKHYKTDDKREILKIMLKDSKIPVWDSDEHLVKIVTRD